MTKWHELPFDQIWAVDTEFYPGRGLAHGGRGGDPVTPLCLTAKELRSGRVIRLWHDELGRSPPYPLDASSLFIAYNNVAEFMFHIALGWGEPARSIDAYVEYRHYWNDGSLEAEDIPKGFFSQLGALQHFGEDTVAHSYKEDMRDRIIRGPPYSAAERAQILDYNETDTAGLARLIPHIIPTIKSIPAALHRSNAMWPFAQHQSRGIPFDMAVFDEVVGVWDAIACDIVGEMDTHGIYSIEGGKPKWGKAEDMKFLALCKRLDIVWPRLESGRPNLNTEIWRDMCVTYPVLNDLRELRSSIGKMRLQKLHVGNDGRNRTSLFPFGTKTSRCAPGANSYVFGPAKWLRFFISPPPGLALVHRDYSQEEPIIAAILSGDSEPLAACEMPCGVYLGLAHQLGFCPADATKDTHSELRDLFKIVVLAILYGMTAPSLARKTRLSLHETREILARLKSRCRKFWDYTERVADHAGLLMRLETAGGWRMICPPDINPNTVRNYPIQSTAAEILRVAVILAERRGLQVIAPVHDALTAQTPLASIHSASEALDRIMRDASAIVLRGYEIKSDEQIIRPGEHYYDKRGEKMWNTIRRLAAKHRRKAS
jgi:DNA polymerase I